MVAIQTQISTFIAPLDWAWNKPSPPIVDSVISPKESVDESTLIWFQWAHWNRTHKAA
jgi:hypothetical protein